jgi:gas vesicle protein
MSKPFKMKGWSGHQNPSPVRKDWKQVVQDFKAVKEDLGSKIKDIGSGDMAKKIKEDLQGLQKEIGQKLGKRKGTDWSESGELAKEIKDTSEIPKVESTVPTDPGDLVENPWTSGLGSDPWQYRKTDKGYQTKKGESGTPIDVTDPKSEAYKKIGEKIFDIESEAVDQPIVESVTEKEVVQNFSGAGYGVGAVNEDGNKLETAQEVRARGGKPTRGFDAYGNTFYYDGDKFAPEWSHSTDPTR